MHKFLLLLTATTLAGCGNSNISAPAKDSAAQHGAQLANQIVGGSSSNAEQENIARRLKLTMNPGQIGFILLMNQAGAPIAYYGVKGKITSSGKRLTQPDFADGYSEHEFVRQAPNDEGTYGSSDPYIYFWTTDGQFVQWNGGYMYSDKPFRLRTQPLVISIAEAKQDSINQ